MTDPIRAAALRLRLLRFGHLPDHDLTVDQFAAWCAAEFDLEEQLRGLESDPPTQDRAGPDSPDLGGIPT